MGRDKALELLKWWTVWSVSFAMRDYYMYLL